MCREKKMYLLPYVKARRRCSSTLYRGERGFFSRGCECERINVCSLVPFLRDMVLGFVMDTSSHVTSRPICISYFLFCFSSRVRRVIVKERIHFRGGGLLLIFQFRTIPRFVNFVYVIDMDNGSRVVFY